MTLSFNGNTVTVTSTGDTVRGGTWGTADSAFGADSATCSAMRPSISQSVVAGFGRTRRRMDTFLAIGIT